jgi:transcription antitermination factor NusG
MKWFVAHTKSRCEVKASDFFKKNGVESYVPVFEEKRQWSDRTKKIITPAISGYVFFKLEKADYSFINLNPFLRNVVRRFGQAVQIHESEIKIMKDCLKHYTENFAFGSGDTVRILSGVLKNKKGFVDGVENNFVILLVNSIKVKLSLKTNKVVAIG